MSVEVPVETTRSFVPSPLTSAIVTNSDEAKALLAESIADDVGAIGPYIAPVQVDDAGKIVPGNLREQIRRSGGTIGSPAQA